MASGNAIRGTRVGAGPMRLPERGEQAPRRSVMYWCANGHQTEPSFAAEVTPPALWDCPRCGLPAGQDQTAPPERPRVEPYKTHLAYVKERRTEAEAEQLLEEAISQLRERRGTVSS